MNKRLLAGIACLSVIGFSIGCYSSSRNSRIAQFDELVRELEKMEDLYENTWPQIQNSALLTDEEKGDLGLVCFLLDVELMNEKNNLIMIYAVYEAARMNRHKEAARVDPLINVLLELIESEGKTPLEFVDEKIKEARVRISRLQNEREKFKQGLAQRLSRK